MSAPDPTSTGNSLLMRSAMWRLSVAVGLVLVLWLAVAWAMST